MASRCGGQKEDVWRGVGHYHSRDFGTIAFRPEPSRHHDGTSHLLENNHGDRDWRRLSIIGGDHI